MDNETDLVPEFDIEFLPTKEFGRSRDELVIFGRLGDGNIELGHEFHAVYRAVLERVDGVLYDRGRAFIAPIRLTVTKIEMYDKEYDRAGHGDCARLTLRGQGVEHVTTDVVLADAPV